MSKVQSERAQEETVALAEKLKSLFRSWGADPVERLEEDGNASQDFADGCDNYQGFAFSAYLNGRHYYVTVEDVTIREEDA